MPRRNLTLLVAACVACLGAYAAREEWATARRFGEVVNLIRRSALEQVDHDDLVAAGVAAAVGKLDEHSAFVRGEERRALEDALDQEFGGVGLELTLDEQHRQPVVVMPVAGGPAWRAGITAGERVVAVDGSATVGLSLEAVVGRLRGRAGETVGLRIATPRPADTLDPGADRSAEVDPERDVVLVREQVRVESVLGDRRRPDGGWEWMIEGATGVALLRITSFGERTAAEAASALDAIAARRGVRGVVVDVRGNPGGLVTAAVDVCDLLLDDGVVVFTRGRARAGGPAVLEPRRARPGTRLAADVPVVVLIDGLTASAAEIVAACLQDTGRARVAGSRSFGKGTVQSLLPLSDGSGLLKLTTSEYLRPSRRPIHRRAADGDAASWGVAPDDGLAVAPTAESLDRLRAWRRRRDAAATGEAAVRLPLDVDEALARAVAALGGGSERGVDLGRQEEAAGHHDDAAAAGE